jgi:hypothetical protein
MKSWHPSIAKIDLLHCQRYKISESYFIHYQKICFIEINDGSLRERLYNQPCLVSHNLIVLILFPDKNPLEPDEWILGGVGITLLNTSLFLSESNSVSTASFHLIQSELFTLYHGFRIKIIEEVSNRGWKAWVDNCVVRSIILWN